MNLLRTAAIGAALAIVACAHSETPPAPTPAVSAPGPFAETLSTAAADFPGVAFTLIRPDGQISQGGAGYADIEAQTPMTAQTQVSVYSVSKSMTATLAVGLAQEGHLDLDRPVGDVATTPAALASFTPRELMAHTSGIRHYRDGEWLRVSRSACATASEALPVFADDPLGSRGVYSYSSFGYVLLSNAIEGATRQPFASVMQERVFTPAGMTNSSLWAPGMRRPPNGYEQSGRRFRPSRAIDNSCKFGAGAVISTAEDLARFGAALRAGRLVSETSWQSMITGPAGDYGLGWGIGTLADGVTPAAVHSGSGMGGTSAIVIDLERGYVAALVGNVDGPSLVDEAKAIIAAARATTP